MLKYKYTKKDDIPTAFVDLYTEKNGEWILTGVDGVVSQEEFIEFRENNRSLNQQVRDLKTKITEFGDITPDKVKGLQDQITDLTAKLESGGGGGGSKQVQDLTSQLDAMTKKIESMQTQYDTQLNTLTTERDQAKQQLQNNMIADAIQSAAINKGIRKTALEDVKLRAQGVAKVQDGKVVIVGPDGQPKYSEKKPSELMSPEEWVEGLQENASHLFEGSGGGGSNNNGLPGGRRISGSDVLEFGRNLEDIAKGKVTVVNEE